MKKITLLLLCIFSITTAISQTTLTHSSDPETIDAGVVCSNDDPQGITSIRVFDMEEFDITTNFLTESVQWGASSLVGAVDHQVTLALSTLDGDIVGGTLTELASVTVSVQEADAGTLFTTPLEALVPEGSVLVFEVRYADDGATFASAGGNGAPQTAPSFADGPCVDGIVDLTEFNITTSFTMNVIGNAILSVDENALSQISIFPNPASDVLTLRVPSTVEITGTTLYDVLGKKTNVSIANGQINVSDLARGVYILNIETNVGSLTEKVVIE